MNPVQRIFRRMLKKSRGRVWSDARTPDLIHSRFRLGATYSPWLSDREFLNAYEVVKEFTLVDIRRCYELWDLAKQTAGVEGCLVEVGVLRGGTGCLLAIAAPAKEVYLADTFEGVVKAGPKDTRYGGGEHADTSEKIVRELLLSAGAANARILKGVFPEETGIRVAGPIALLHIDVDVYESGKEIVRWSLPHLPAGATIVFDDYGFDGCEGITRLVRELRGLRGSRGSLADFRFVHNLNGHAIFVRIERQ